MDFNQVRYFLALAETLNFTRAAERCHVTQPALTQAIRRLEDSLNGKLIERDGRDTRLTELGSAVRVQFEKIDATRRLVHQTASSFANEEQRELNLGVVCTLSSKCLVPVFSSPKIKTRLTSLTLHDVTPQSWPQLLKSGSLDGVFCADDPQRDSNIEFFPLFQEHVGVAFSVNHPFASATGEITASEVFEHPYIDRLDCEFREFVLAICERERFDVNVVCRSQREDWIQRLVAAGLGTTIIPENSVVDTNIRVRRLSDPSISRTVAFACLNQPDRSPALRNLVDQIQQTDWTREQNQPA